MPPEVGVAWKPYGLLFLRKPECINSDYPREGSGARRLGGDPPPDQKWILHNLSHVYCDEIILHPDKGRCVLGTMVGTKVTQKGWVANSSVQAANILVLITFIVEIFSAACPAL